MEVSVLGLRERERERLTRRSTASEEMFFQGEVFKRVMAMIEGWFLFFFFCEAVRCDTKSGLNTFFENLFKVRLGNSL